MKMYIFLSFLASLFFLINVCLTMTINKDPLLVDSNNYNVRRKRDMIDISYYKWHLNIEYYVGSECNSWQDSIRAALNNIQKNTCFNFTKTTTLIRNRYGINFVLGSECKTQMIGRNPDPNPRPNYIYLHGCLKHTGFIQRLIHNTLGDDGEHNRYDRNSFITVNKNNVNPKYESKLFKDEYSYKNYSIEYDYGSLTHAGPYEYGKHGERVIAATKYDEYYKNMMGQTIKASFNDYKYLNFHYCNHTCKPSDLPEPCHFNGYQDPRNCKQCKCPSGFEGPICYSLARSSPDCGYTGIIARSNEQTLEVRGDKSCWYKIEASKGKHVVLKLGLIRILGEHNPCLDDYEGVQIKYRKDRGATGLSICQSNGVSFTTEYHNYEIRSEDNKMFVHFRGIGYDSWANLYYREVQ